MAYQNWKKEYLSKTHEISVSNLTALQNENARRSMAGLAPLTKQEFEQRISLYAKK